MLDSVLGYYMWRFFGPIIKTSVLFCCCCCCFFLQNLAVGNYSPKIMETMGVAQLTGSGLSTDVVETLRKLYTLKWKLFKSWCEDQQLDPVNCMVGSVLKSCKIVYLQG